MTTSAHSLAPAIPPGTATLPLRDRHGGHSIADGRRRPRWRTWLVAGALACMGVSAVANDDEPGLPNRAQLSAISVGGLSASYPVGADDDPLHITVPPFVIDHCAPQVLTMTGWQPTGVPHEVTVLGQSLQLDSSTPTRSVELSPLAFGTTAFDIHVRRFFALGHWTSSRYSLTIQRSGPGTNAELANIALSGGTLSPPFDPSVTHYSATVNMPSVAVVPVAVDCPALTVNGQPVASGGAAQVPLALGPNTVTLQSTAQDGTARTFTLALTRVPNSDAQLQSLSLSAGTLSPGFDTAITHYTASVPYIPSVSVTAAPTVSSASLQVNGVPVAADTPQAVPLQVPTTAVTVGVTSEDGSATRHYTVEVTRAAPSTNATLSALTLSAGTLTPAFDPAVASYSASVGNAVDAVDVRPTVAFSAATVTVNGTPVASGGAVRVALVAGINTITVQATAQDGTTQQVYTVRVMRASADNSARLLGLQLSSGAAWPPVHPTSLAYTARVPSATAAIALTPTAADVTGPITIQGGGPILSGETSAPIPLQPGHNPITIQVTSTDGQQVATYTLDVLRGTTDAALASLTLSDGSLSPAFDPGVLAYSASVPYVMSSVRVGLALSDADAVARVGRWVLRSGHTAAVALAPGLNTVPVAVTSSDGTVQRTYVLQITREPSGAMPLAANPVQFAAPQGVPLSVDFVAALAAADVDSDGFADALALEHTQPGLAIARSRGGSGMDTAQRLPLGIQYALRLAVGDVHGDGRPDVVTVGTAETRLAVGTGTGLGTAGLAVRPVQLPEALRNYAPTVLVDVDGDGRDDIVSARAQGVMVLGSLGDGHFAPGQTVGTLDDVQYVLGQDLNGDGHLDLLLANQAGALQRVPGMGGGAFGAPQPLSLGATGPVSLRASPRVADLNRDGRPDLIVAAQADGANKVFVFLGLPGGGFGSPERLHSGASNLVGNESADDLAVADFNGDGHLDIAVLTVNGWGTFIYTLAGQGDGSFAAPAPYPLGWRPYRMDVADFDGDGKPDLVTDVPIGGGGGLRVLHNTAPDLGLVVPSTGTLSPAFRGDVTEYALQLPHGGPPLTLTPWLAFGTATVRIGGVPVASGSASAPIAVPAGGIVPITVEVQARDGSTRTYTLSATRALAVSATANPPAGGTATCTPGLVAHGTNATCNATASAGYEFTGWSGACAGQGAACSVLNVQGPSASVALFAQVQSLPVREGPQAQQPLRLALQPGNGWRVWDSATLTAAGTAPTLPRGFTLPHGTVYLVLTGGVRGSQATVVLTFPAPLPPGAVYYKYGPTAGNPQDHWYPFPGAQISGNTVTLTLQDGGAGDSDRTANGFIVDPGGVAVPVAVTPPVTGAAPIPTLQTWGLWLLSLLAALVAGPRLRRMSASSRHGA